MLFVQMNDHLGVGIGVEPMTSREQLRAQFAVVEDLAIEDRPYGAIFVVNRLPAALQVHNAQSRAAHPDVGIPVHAKLVGAAMPLNGDHLLEEINVDGPVALHVEDSSDTAHARESPELRLGDQGSCRSAMTNH